MDNDLASIPGVGPVTSKQLARLGMTTRRDLLLHLPSRYIDRSTITPIAAVRRDRQETVAGTISQVVVQRTRRRGLWLIRCILKDDSGQISLAWFTRGYGNQMPKSPVQTGDTGVATGRVTASNRGLEMVAPLWEQSPHFTRDVQQPWPPIPIYPLTAGLTQKKIKQFISWALDHVTIDDQEDLLPPVPLALPGFKDALQYVHRPRSLAEAEAGRRRLAFEEAVAFYRTVRNRRHNAGGQKIRCVAPWSLSDYERHLPFQLTTAQQKAIRSLDTLLQTADPRHVLLQGDVGSGKTVVAAFACAKAVLSRMQAVVMAPTRLLAEQHQRTLQRLLSPWNIDVALLTSKVSTKDRSDLLHRLEAGDPLIVVGTTALISSDVIIARPAIAIVDEQHRFGVKERQALGRFGPIHIVEMTATPIPRSLALVLYSDHEVIALDEKPPGRAPVDTRWIHPNDRPRVYDFLRRQVSDGQLGYVVFPRIDTGDENASGVIQGYQSLVQRELKGCRVGMIHGLMSPDEQDDVMSAFVRGEIQVLCATTVIEVGVDVPQATVMIIEEADRFGLAQLHQLRGRVGRGQAQGYALLIADPGNSLAIQKIDILRKTDDGFTIAEKDMELRGPGELDGLRQTGAPAFRALDLHKDLDVLALAKQWVSTKGARP